MNFKIQIYYVLLAVVLAAVALAALRSANELWAGALLLLDLWLIGISVLASIYKSGRDRAWWLGFGLFDAAYLILAFGPWFSTELAPKLGTTQSLEYLHYLATGSLVRQTDSADKLIEEFSELQEKQKISRRLVRSPENDPMVRQFQAREDELRARIADVRGYPVPDTAATNTSGRQAGVGGLATWLPGARNREPFLRVGHCLCAFLAGITGAIAAHRFCSERERREEQNRAGSMIGIHSN